MCPPRPQHQPRGTHNAISTQRAVRLYLPKSLAPSEAVVPLHISPLSRDILPLSAHPLSSNIRLSRLHLLPSLSPSLDRASHPIIHHHYPLQLRSLGRAMSVSRFTLYHAVLDPILIEPTTLLPPYPSHPPLPTFHLPGPRPMPAHPLLLGQ
jgi:hypothetical protein